MGQESLIPLGTAIASNRVAKEGRKVRFMYREVPRNRYDSGWAFFCGDEDQAYADNPDNFALYDVSTIAAIDPSITTFLNTEPPCAFERETVAGRFRQSTNFHFAPERSR